MAGKRTIRQAARRAALEIHAARRADQVARDRRLKELAEEVLTALGERDAAVLAAECRAGQALTAMTSAEGCSVTEANSWFAGRLSTREAARLRQLATTAIEASGGGSMAWTVTTTRRRGATASSSTQHVEQVVHVGRLPAPIDADG